MISQAYLFRSVQWNLSFWLIGIAASLAAPLAVPTELSGQGQSDSSDNTSTIVGDWRGESSCVVKPSGCRDEDSLYHFSRHEGKPGWFSLKGDKIVDGKPITMGTMDCSSDRGARTLQCQLPSGSIRFELKGDRMEGTMTLQDGTFWRRLSLGKVK